MIRRQDLEPLVAAALAEDLGDAGDLTSMATIPIAAQASADIVARASGVLAGVPVAAEVFRQVDASIQFATILAEGSRLAPGDVVASVSGPARSVLGAERTALNLLSRMSGVATATAGLVALVEGTGARVTDTRKTMPGLRALDKYAVTVGGGVNHRMGLYDAVMIKDNHLVAGMTIEDGVAAARSEVGPDVAITVEVESLDQLDEVLATDADRVLLDNMGIGQLAEAVDRVAGRIETEASGGITAANIGDVARTGVDLISVGWITHSAPQLDMALDFRSGG